MSKRHVAIAGAILRVASFGLLSLTSLLTTARTALGNIVSDPGFESTGAAAYTGPLGDGWTVLQGTVAITSNTIFANIAHSGSQAALLDYGSGMNVLNQTLSTINGQSYDISFFLSDDTGGNDLMVSFGSATILSITTPLTGIGAYDLFSLTARATGPSTALKFSGLFTDTAGVGTILDDVSVTPVAATSVPEPSSTLLTGAGLTWLALTRIPWNRLLRP